MGEREVGVRNWPGNPKSEDRRPKEGRSPKAEEARLFRGRRRGKAGRLVIAIRCAQGWAVTAGARRWFEFRTSAFGFRVSPASSSPAAKPQEPADKCQIHQRGHQRLKKCYSSQPKPDESCCQRQCHHPPIPGNPARHRAPFAKLALDEVVVIEILLRQVQAARARFLRPAGFLIRAAFGTGSGFGRDFSAAIGASLGRHVSPFPRIPRPSSIAPPLARSRERGLACPSRNPPAAPDC
jgi:hypothetical protein